MNSSSLISVLLLSCFIFTGFAKAQEAARYEPRDTRPEGTQLVAVYMGGHDCAPCHDPENKQLVREMKSSLSEVADEKGWSFKAVGVSLSYGVQEGYDFLGENGKFDEIIVGNNWTNLAGETHIWRVENGRPAIPHVIVYKQEVELKETGIEFGERFDVKRFSLSDLHEWLEEEGSWEELALSEK